MSVNQRHEPYTLVILNMDMTCPASLKFLPNYVHFGTSHRSGQLQQTLKGIQQEQKPKH